MTTLESYLNDLCRALSVEALRGDEIRLEAHLTLRKRTDAMIRKGEDPARAEEQAIREFGTVEESAARLSGSPSGLITTQLAQPVYNAGVVLVGLSFFWLSYGLSQLHLIYDYLLRLPKVALVFDLGGLGGYAD
jgi:hypothetical protein